MENGLVKRLWNLDRQNATEKEAWSGTKFQHPSKKAYLSYQGGFGADVRGQLFQDVLFQKTTNICYNTDGRRCIPKALFQLF